MGLKRPQRADLPHPNLATVLGFDIGQIRRTSAGATIVSMKESVFLFTTLDALTFESGRRTVDIALVTNSAGACTECDIIKDVDSFRFSWIDAAPNHCALKLTPTEVALVRKCEVWAFYETPRDAATAGDGAVGDGPALEAVGKGVELSDGASGRRYDPISASTNVDPDDAERLPLVPIAPPTDRRLAGCPFVHDSQSGWLWLMGIGDSAEGMRPLTQLVGEGPIIELINAIESGASRPVTELDMLQRHFRRTGVPADYEGLRAFLAEHRLDGLLHWQEVEIADGVYEGPYRLQQRAGVQGDRALAAVSRGTGHDLSMTLAGKVLGDRWRGTDTDRAPDAVVAVSGRELQGLGEGTSLEVALKINGPAGSSMRAMVLETSTIGERAAGLPAAGAR